MSKVRRVQTLSEAHTDERFHFEAERRIFEGDMQRRYFELMDVLKSRMTIDRLVQTQRAMSGLDILLSSESARIRQSYENQVVL